VKKIAKIQNFASHLVVVRVQLVAYLHVLLHPEAVHRWRKQARMVFHNYRSLRLPNTYPLGSSDRHVSPDFSLSENCCYPT